MQYARKAPLLLFDINLCSFVHSGLNEIWRFSMFTFWYEVASMRRLVYVFNQWYIRYLFDTAFSQSFVWPEMLQHWMLSCCVPIKILEQGFFRLIHKWMSGLKLRRMPDRGPKSGRMATLLWLPAWPHLFPKSSDIILSVDNGLHQFIFR